MVVRGYGDIISDLGDQYHTCCKYTWAPWCHKVSPPLGKWLCLILYSAGRMNTFPSNQMQHLQPSYFLLEGVMPGVGGVLFFLVGLTLLGRRGVRVRWEECEEEEDEQKEEKRGCELNSWERGTRREERGQKNRHLGSPQYKEALFVAPPQNRPSGKALYSPIKRKAQRSCKNSRANWLENKCCLIHSKYFIQDLEAPVRVSADICLSRTQF